MKCTVCGAGGSLEDNFCRRCGATQRNLRLPVKIAPPTPPAVWKQAAPVIARGAALVAAGVIGEWLLRTATKRALAAPFGGRRGSPKGRSLTKKQDAALPEGVLAISETVIARRLVVRR